MLQLTKRIEKERLFQESLWENIVQSQRISQEIFSILHKMSPFDCFELLNSGLLLTDIERKNVLLQAEWVICLFIKICWLKTLFRLINEWKNFLSDCCLKKISYEIQIRYIKKINWLSLKELLELYIEINALSSMNLFKEDVNVLIVDEFFKALENYKFFETDYTFIVASLLKVVKTNISTKWELDPKLFNFIKIYVYSVFKQMSIDESIIFCGIFKNFFLNVDEKTYLYLENELLALNRVKSRKEREASSNYKSNKSSNQHSSRSSWFKFWQKVSKWFSDLLDLFWLSSWATKKDVISAFRKLALIHHPDAWWTNEEMIYLIWARDKLISCLNS